MKSTLLPYKASLELHTFTSYQVGLSHMITCSRPPKPPVCPILSAVTYGSLFPIGLLACNRSNAIWLPSHCPRNTALSMFSNGFMLLSARDTSRSLPYLSPEQHLTQLTGFSVLGTGILTPLFSSLDSRLSLNVLSCLLSGLTPWVPLNLLFCICLSSLKVFSAPVVFTTGMHLRIHLHPRPFSCALSD